MERILSKIYKEQFLVVVEMKNYENLIYGNIKSIVDTWKRENSCKRSGKDNLLLFWELEVSFMKLSRKVQK